MAGLSIGKPLGIWLFSLIGVSIGLCTLPSDLRWRDLIGAGFLGGIGFTMSIFIGLLAFEAPEMIKISKIAVFIGSFVAGVIGIVLLKLTLKTPVTDEENPGVKKNKG